PLWPRPLSAAQHDEHQTTEPIKAADQHAEQVKEKKEEQKNALHHVMDTYEWELFDSFGPHSIHLPYIEIGHFRIGLSKFVILEIIAALLVAAIYIPLGQSIRAGHVPRGTFANFFEVFLTFIRDQVAKPGVGEHDADKYVPFLWTLFVFILFN